MENAGTTPNDVERVAVAGLQRRHRVRRALDAEHVELLAEVLDQCPPILLGRDGTLVDGEHRVAAARQLGITELPSVTLPVGSDVDAELICAIEANTSHGRPLTREERRDAVRALLAVRPEMSDRGIAQICGVSRAVVATVRAATPCSGGSTDHLNGRVGRDGKLYGTCRLGWRVHLEALVRVDPRMSVRALVERTGSSVGAVHACRRELLEKLDTEPHLLRWWRRLRARWVLRHRQGGQ